MKGRILSAMRGTNGIGMMVSEIPNSEVPRLAALIGKEADIDAKKWRSPRSKEANRLLWAVCTEIADALHSTKVEVYRNTIRQVGRYYSTSMPNGEVAAFCEDWAHNGIGWFAEIADHGDKSDHSLVFAYIGSSKYNSQQFSLLVDSLLYDAKEAGITLKAGPELELKAKEMGM